MILLIDAVVDVPHHEDLVLLLFPLGYLLGQVIQESLPREDFTVNLGEVSQVLGINRATPWARRDGSVARDNPEGRFPLSSEALPRPSAQTCWIHVCIFALANEVA